MRSYRQGGRSLYILYTQYLHVQYMYHMYGSYIHKCICSFHKQDGLTLWSYSCGFTDQTTYVFLVTTSSISLKVLLILDGLENLIESCVFLGNYQILGDVSATGSAPVITGRGVDDSKNLISLSFFFFIRFLKIFLHRVQERGLLKHPTL